jgi:hypothetical protein
LALNFTTHVEFALATAPVQPAKSWSAAGLAVRVTTVPSGNTAEQVVAQRMPAGTLLTDPAPLLVTVSVESVRFAVELLSGVPLPHAARASRTSVDGIRRQRELQTFMIRPSKQSK